MKNDKKKVCILASGGDAPGMNACIEAFFNYASHLGWEVFVAQRGYDGLIHNDIVRATREQCNNISHITGCVYKCSRAPEFRTDEGKKKAAQNLKAHGFDALVVIGGNGSLAGLENFVKLTGVNAVGIPATVDNDCYYTNNALGFSSAIEGIVQYIDKIKPTMQTNDRSFMLEVMGKGCSELAINAGISGFANLIDRSENRLTPQQIGNFFNEQRKLGNKSCMAIIEEHRADADTTFLKEVQAVAGKDIRFERGYYYQRGATPSARDRFLGAHYGVKAVDVIAQGTFGVALGMINGEVRVFSLAEANNAKPLFNTRNSGIIEKITSY